MGPFDNETGQYLFDESYDGGHWYLHESCLFIAPDGEAEIEGPDGAFVDRLNDIYREKLFLDIDPLLVAELLECEFIHASLRRFDSRCGFYVA